MLHAFSPCQEIAFYIIIHSDDIILYCVVKWNTSSVLNEMQLSQVFSFLYLCNFFFPNLNVGLYIFIKNHLVAFKVNYYSL